MPTNKKKRGKKKKMKPSGSDGGTSSSSLGPGLAGLGSFDETMAQLKSAGPGLSQEQMKLIVDGHFPPGQRSDFDFEGASRREQERQRLQDEKVYKDNARTSQCEGRACSNKGTSWCGRCKCRAFCSTDCMKTAWDMYHKNECRKLEACSRAPDLASDHPVGDELFTTLGVARTKNHGPSVFCMENYEYTGNESNRMVPLASVRLANDVPTEHDLLKCLIRAILRPEFDTIFAGSRKPHNLRILTSTIANDDASKRAAAVATRIGCTVELTEEGYELEDGSWETSWFCVQMGWDVEVTDKLFSAMIERSRWHPLQPNGSARKAFAKLLDATNETAAKLPEESFPSREQVLSLPSAKDISMAFAIFEGILYIWIGDTKLVYHRPIILQANARPKVDDVLGPLYKACILIGRRPAQMAIGQPSICSLEDVGPYEEALDESVCTSFVMLAQLHNLEGILKVLVPRWRRAGLLS